MVLTDLHFADDIALLSDDIEKVQKVLSAVEGECMKVGLGLNTKKTKYLADNIDNPTPQSTFPQRLFHGELSAKQTMRTECTTKR